MSCWSAFKLGIAGLLVTVAVASPAELKKQTLDAWDQYLAQQNLKIRDHATPGHCFLRIEHDPQTMQDVHDGSVVVNPIDDRGPKRIPGGLIHHWIGDAFIAGVTLDDVMSVTRNYTRYAEFYKPGVETAETISSDANRDDFILYMENGSFFSRNLLKGEYISDFVRLDDKRLYVTSRTKQMQEIRDYGEADEKSIPPGKGSGYIWRMFSTARFEERDGGVYLELEAIALSRDIPLTLHWLVDPIVRHVSHDSLEKSLQDTSRAARSHNLLAQASR